MPEFEDVLHGVGDFGKYQKSFVVFFIIPMSCIVSWVTLDAIFMVSVPDHWCHVPSVAASNLSEVEQRALVSPPHDPSCLVYDFNFTDALSQGLVTVPNVTGVVKCTSGWQYDTSIYQMTAATKWNMVCDHMYYPSLVLTLTKMGSFLMSPLYGFLADRYGRKTMYLVIAAVASVGEITSALVDNFVAFTIARIIVGGAMPSLYCMPFILLLEIVSPKMRGHMNGIINVVWTIGFSLLPLVVYLSGSYVNLGIVCSLTSASVLLYYRLIPESPCWLISKGKYEEAAKILQRIGEVNGKPKDKETLMNQIQVLGDSKKKEKRSSLLKNKSIYLLINNARIRRHFFILAFSWTAFNATYYGTFFNVRNLSGNELVNFFLLCVVEVPGNLLFWALMDRAGRRWTGSIAFLVMGVIFLGPLTGLPYADTIFAMISKVISTGIFMVVDQQGAELFPTVLRSFCMGLAKTIANILTLFIPFFADLGSLDKRYPFLVMSGLSFAAGVFSSFLPETLNENLPQTIADAEGFGKDQKYFSWIRKKHSINSSNQNGNSQSRTLDKDPEPSEKMKMVEVDLK